jgi:hypothetical protein
VRAGLLCRVFLKKEDFRAFPVVKFLNQFRCERVSEVVKLFKIQGIPLEFYKFWFYGFHSRAKGDEEIMSRRLEAPNSMKSIVQRLGFCYHKVVPFQG